MRQLDNVADVIQALGGVQATATMFGRSHNCVYDWRAVGQFPPATYLAIKRALKRQKLAADLNLWRWDAPAARSVGLGHDRGVIDRRTER